MYIYVYLYMYIHRRTAGGGRSDLFISEGGEGSCCCILRQAQQVLELAPVPVAAPQHYIMAHCCLLT